MCSSEHTRDVAFMTQTTDRSGGKDPVLFAPLDSLSIPEHAVVVIDEALPETALQRFDSPLLVQAGEELKTLSRVEELAESILERRATRPLTIVAVGGGSVGDAVGFLASVLWRGVSLWHVPSTLLAMVDSAHGGKTAVNLGKHKNQLGSFYTAEKVLISPEFLGTLPFAQREQGLAELLKALWLGAPDALDLWDAHGGGQTLAAAPFAEVEDRLMRLLRIAIDVKYDVVRRDPHETREIRTFLNLGHTTAHALELHLGLYHGHAVAWGLAAAAVASREHAALDRVDTQRLFDQLYPLLEPIHDDQIPDFETFASLVARDKKKRRGELRSVLLNAPGEPLVKTLRAKDWYEAFCEAFETWRDRDVVITKPFDYPAKFELEPSKSEVNRAQIIAHLRDSARVESLSQAADVTYLCAALAVFDGQEPTDRVEVEAGSGGTTFRFLLAAAACRPGTTEIHLSDRLFDRPHQPLIDALTRAGALISSDATGKLVTVKGWSKMPTSFEVDASISSQFASALALLSARLRPGDSLELQVLEGLASPPYFEITLELLKRAGVEVVATGAMRWKFISRMNAPTVIACDADASSAAAWVCAADLGLDAEVSNIAPLDSMQPDARLPSILAGVREGNERVDVSDCPDIVPVLAAWAALARIDLEICGAAHLKVKESNRIEDLAEELAKFELELEIRQDGLAIYGSRFGDAPDSVHWHTHDDHRLAFAALLMSLNATNPRIQISDPWVVRKSYPRFYHDARRLGFSIELADQ